MKATSGGVKTFATEKAAKAGLKRAGLAQLPHRVKYHDVAGSAGYTCVVTVELPEDAHEVRDRGFLPEVQK